MARVAGYVRGVGGAILAILLLGGSVPGGGMAWARLPEASTVLAQTLRGGLALSVERGCDATYVHQDRLNITVRSERPGFLTVFDFVPDGRVQIIFPNRYAAENRIEAQTTYEIPGSLYPFELRVGPPDGTELLFAVVTDDPRPLVPGDYTAYSSAFAQVQGEAASVARGLAKELQIIPTSTWWAAALCAFTVSPPPASAEAGRAVFIGISAYLAHEVASAGRTFGIGDLRFASDDAREMSRALERAYPAQRVLVDDEATYASIRDAIVAWLGEAPADAPILVYFSGHGGHQPDTDGDEEDGQDETLIAADARAIADDELAVWLSGLPAREIVLIVDACHAGTSSRGARTFLTTEKSVWGSLSDGLASDLGASGEKGPARIVALEACRPWEAAYEAPSLGHGLFTACLLEGLGGPGDGDGDRLISAQELFAYAAACTSSQSTLGLVPGPQHPQLRDDAGRPVVVLRLAP